jgi:hypothetical protein
MVTLIVVVALSAATPASARPHVDVKHCRFGAMDGNWHRWSTREAKRTIRCAVNRFPTSLSTAMYVADRESHFYAKAVNSSSGACPGLTDPDLSEPSGCA